MSATVNASPLERSLRRVWAGLPDGSLGERDLEERILKITNHGDGDFAWAGAVRAQLVSAHAVIVRPGENPRERVYERADTFPEAPSDNGYGSDAFNDELRRLSEKEQAQLRALDEQRAQEFEDSPLAWQRRQILELIDQRVDEKFAELLASLDDDTIARVRARLNRDAA